MSPNCTLYYSFNLQWLLNSMGSPCPIYLWYLVYQPLTLLIINTSYGLFDMIILGFLVCRAELRFSWTYVYLLHLNDFPY